ncbi:hypothetical protein RIVM261_035260 [Rivularia sp. IAM M-261]|nr:hypothetical protein RIVM261_035260 [Rivularia sp. IAM M-261]
MLFKNKVYLKIYYEDTSRIQKYYIIIKPGLMSNNQLLTQILINPYDTEVFNQGLACLQSLT